MLLQDLNKGKMMEKSRSFPFGVLDMFDDYAIITCQDGVNVDFIEIEEIYNTLLDNYQEHKIVLIANRKNHYSVNPIAISALFSKEFLIGGAVLGYSPITEKNAAIESTIVKSAPIRYFTQMEDILEWVIELNTTQTH